MTIRRILIANRGEIALRIIRTCRKLGIETILAASDADLDSLPARLADRVVRVGPAQSAQSYLNAQAIITAAKDAKASAIHPGYGFLSESIALAAEARRAGLIFIGPAEEQLAATGNKLRAREIAAEAGLPVVPGGAISSLAEAKALIGTIGCPVLVKAVGGGGGRGMKLLEDPAKAEETIALAMAEAEAAFADSRVYLERFIARGRHVEVQLLGDGERIVHLGERDCSIQRRYQKLVEEARAPALDEGFCTRLSDAAVKFCEAISYRSAGTVEFLVAPEREAFYFLEMNARIQVEHPVTEAITGLDLVEEQIAICEGRALRIRQEDVRFDGHAIEFRINAEDATRDFRPSPGRITRAAFPAGEGIRVDTHIEAGSTIPPFYDSLIAKIIVHEKDRPSALRLARTAIACCRIEGVATNLDMHRALLDDPEFVRGGVDTAYFARRWQSRGGKS